MRNKKSREYSAEWLRRTLRNRGISKGALARAVDVTPSAVTRWTQGGSISLDKVETLAEYLDVDFVALAVTFGLMSTKATSVEPLPMPENTAQRQYVLDQLSKIRDITEEQREILMHAYEADLQRRFEDSNSE